MYARSFDGAGAVRAGDALEHGELRLGAWRSYPGDPTLNWTARQVASGWVLETAEIR